MENLTITSSDLVMRFHKRVQESAKSDVHTTKCWWWTGFTDPAGCGRIKLEGRSELAHRVAYRIYRGAIPAGHEVRHGCGRNWCVNPDHLELVPEAGPTE